MLFTLSFGASSWALNFFEGSVCPYGTYIGLKVAPYVGFRDVQGLGFRGRNLGVKVCTLFGHMDP